MCSTSTVLKHEARQKDYHLLEGSINLGRGYAGLLVMMHVEKVHVASPMERLTISADILLDSRFQTAFGIWLSKDFFMIVLAIYANINKNF